MKEPTQEQVKELWEWCGFRLADGSGYLLAECPIEYPLGFHLPIIDLNNLFKYAVPKDADVQVSTGRGLAGEINRWVVAIGISGKWYRAEDKDAALALFWAIYEVIK